MDIKPSGSVPSRRGPADSFTGTVWQDPIIEAPAPARLRGAFVRFEPRARTAWHTHPLGQTLHVISGVGRVALWGGPVILGGLGGLFSLIGGGMVFVPMLSRRRADELRQHGMAVQTEFQSIEQNTSLTVNGRSPWRIVSQWKDSSSWCFARGVASTW